MESNVKKMNICHIYIRQGHVAVQKKLTQHWDSIVNHISFNKNFRKDFFWQKRKILKHCHSENILKIYL